MCLMQASCAEKQTVDPRLQGSWSQRIMVPENQQGRCVDETISFDKTSWRSDVIVHATFACDQPYYAVSFKGQVSLPDADTQNKNGIDDPVSALASFMVSDIEVVSIANIHDGNYDYLSDDGVENLSPGLLADQYKAFVFSPVLEQHGLDLTVFPPVLAFVTDNYRDADASHRYEKLR